MGLRRARARVLGRPLRGRPGRRRLGLREGEARAARATSAAGRSARTSSGRRSATRSTRATRAILPPEVWGDGDPAGVQERAAERMKDTARAAAAFGVTQVNGFTGSPVWHMLYSFPPNDFDEIERGYERVRRAVGADPRRLRRRGRALRARGAPDRDRLRLRHHAEDARRDGQPRGASGSTSTRPTSCTSSSTRCGSSRSSPTAIYHVHVKDSKVRTDGRRSILGLAPQLRRGRARLGLRLARPRRRRLRGALPRAEPDRLRGAAVDRVGGFGDGPRARRAGRARLRPAVRDFAPSDVAFDAAMQR